MRCDHYEAVVVPELGAAYCTECAPEEYDAFPIFASSEWEWPGVTCDNCGELHDYMCILPPNPYDVLHKLVKWMNKEKTCEESLIRAKQWLKNEWDVHDLWESKDPQDIYLKFCFLVREQICTFEVHQLLNDALLEDRHIRNISLSITDLTTLRHWQDVLRKVKGYWQNQLVEHFVYLLHWDEESERAVSSVLYCLEHMRGEEYLLELDKRLQEMVEWDELLGETIKLVGKE